MSGQQIGTVVGGVVGAVIGFYAGGNVALGWQLGAAAGGVIGGAVDPTKIYGPHIGQGQAQTSSTGVPIAWVQGTAKVAGTLMCVGPRREVKVNDDGKGSGTVQVTYEAHQSYAILICESSELKDSTIDSVVMVEQDGKIVYDIRPGSKIFADSQKWKAGVQFYYGAEDQLPDPTLEAIFGVGNVPAYRGRCIAVFTDINISAFGDRIPQYLFTVASSTQAIVPDNVLEDYVLPKLDAEIPIYGAGSSVETFVSTKAYSIVELAGQPAVGDYLITSLGLASNGGVPPGAHGSFWAFGRESIVAVDYCPATTSADIAIGVEAAGRILNAPLADYTTGWQDYFAALSADVAAWFDLYQIPEPDVVGNGVDDSSPIIVDTDHGIIQGIALTEIENPEREFDTVSRRPQVQVALTGWRNLVRFDRLYWQDIDDGSIWRPSWVTPYAQTTNDPLSLDLAMVVARICRRGGLSDSDFDVSALADTNVYGYPIATQCTGDQALFTLLSAYFAFGTEIDGKLVFKFYGEDAVQTVSREDLVINDATDGAISITRRNQATEFPQKVVATFIDPDQNYDTNTVTAERLATTVIAIGETDVQIPVTMDADQAAQQADKALKIAYATLEGTQDYSVPYASPSAVYLSVCAGEPVLMDGKRWVVDEVLIGNMSIKFSTRYDRQSAYTSTVQAVKPNPPTPPTSQYSGPTLLLPMNLPSLRPQDTYGVYLAAKGLNEDNWRGCTVQVSYDGKISWQNALTINLASIMGRLAEDDSEVSNGTESFVDIGSNDTLESVTESQLDAQANPCALVDSSNVAEVRQFGTASFEQTSNGSFWKLTDERTGLLGTAYKKYAAGDQFTMLDAVYFLPIDLSFKGKTLYFRGVGFGEVAEDQAIVALVYDPDTTVIIDGGTVTP